jgi:glutaredoxin
MIIYTNVGCGHCNDLKEKLKKLGIKYEERNVDEHMDEAQAIARRLKATSLPLVVHNGMEYSDPPLSIIT